MDVERAATVGEKVEQGGDPTGRKRLIRAKPVCDRDNRWADLNDRLTAGVHDDAQRRAGRGVGVLEHLIKTARKTITHGGARQLDRTGGVNGGTPGFDAGSKLTVEMMAAQVRL